jgi:hypothetical protein
VSIPAGRIESAPANARWPLGEIKTPEESANLTASSRHGQLIKLRGSGMSRAGTGKAPVHLQVCRCEVDAASVCTARWWDTKDGPDSPAGVTQ